MQRAACTCTLDELSLSPQRVFCWGPATGLGVLEREERIPDFWSRICALRSGLEDRPQFAYAELLYCLQSSRHSGYARQGPTGRDASGLGREKARRRRRLRTRSVQQGRALSKSRRSARFRTGYSRAADVSLVLPDMECQPARQPR